MPVEYEIDAERPLIRTRCHGAVNFEEVVEHFRVLQEDPRLPDRVDVLLDFSDLTSHPDRDQTRSVALEVRRLLPTVEWGRCAIVAVDDLSFGIGRMFGMLCEPYFADAMVFRSHGEAETWLSSPDG